MIDNKKYFIKTQGCQMNVYDSEKISDLLVHHFDMTSTDNPITADILILNTCSIREKAQEKVFSELGRWKKIKKIKPGTIIAVGGCVASQEGKQLKQRAPYVDIVFGPQTLHRLPKMIDEVKLKSIKPIDVSFPLIEKFDFVFLEITLCAARGIAAPIKRPKGISTDRETCTRSARRQTERLQTRNCGRKLRLYLK